jgi:ABC-2 type transport system ATP-binding protein
VLCDRVAIMDRGRVIACDSPAALVRTLGVAATVGAHISEGTLPEVDLAVISGVTAVVAQNGAIELQTRDVQQTLVGLLDLARQHQVTLTDLRARQSTLEDVFLSLTGRKYENEEAGVQASEAAEQCGRRRRGRR